MTVRNALAGVAVTDLASSKRWYQRATGLDPSPLPAEMKELAEWRFGDGGALQLFVDDARAGRSSVTFAVEDLAAQLDALRKAGVAIGQTSETKDVKTAIVADPDGNQVVFAQALGGNLAR